MDEGIDSYWVECTFEEAEKYVFPYLSTEQLELSMENYNSRSLGHKNFQMETNCLYYLVSKDSQSIISFPWYYPYSGHWNSYSTFEKIKEVKTNSLNDVSNLTTAEFKTMVKYE